MQDNKDINIFLEDIERSISEIVDTRNRIIHGYDSVSEDVLWLIIVNYLPNLEKLVKELLVR